ncbi:MAG: hypothetical protein Q9166_002021 [cf. Caloplaca sp. 2 TL-2023]
MSNGQLVTHLRAVVEFEDFKSTILGALSQTQKRNAVESSTELKAQEGDTDVNQNEAQPGEQSSTPVPSPPLQQRSTSSTPASSTLQRVMEDRRKRLEAEKAAEDAAEKERLKAVAQARREAASSGKSGTPESKQSLYAQEQRKRQQEAKAERERILREIENDKAARKEKEAERRALAKADAADIAQAENALEVSSAKPPNWAASTHVQQCALQVRLFNGVTIRGRFEPQATLSKDIRTWIAEQRTDGDTPFTLKQIVTPLPSRTITISEEEESLQSLGLLPSATLVMVPIQGYTGAYASGQGIVGKAVSLGYNAASTGRNMLVGALGTVLGFGRAVPNNEEPTPNENPGQAQAAVGEGVRYRTLRSQQEEDTDHQLYNGNQV